MNAIKTLADRFQLVGPNIDEDWYEAHGKPCLTKQGIQKIAAALDIRLTPNEPKVVPPLVLFTGSASHVDEKEHMTVVHEVGSCRFDGQKNTPERTFAPEMAFKRWKGRAVSALACRILGIHGTVYTEDEMAHIGDNASVSPAPAPAPQPAPAQAAPQNAPQEAPQGYQAGREGAAWRDCVERVSSLCGVPPSTQFGEGKYAPDLSTVLLKDSGKFQGKDGSWVTVNTHSTKGTPTWAALHQKKAKWAAAALEKLQRTVKMLEAGDRVTISYDSYENGQVVWHNYDLVPTPVGTTPPSPPSAYDHAQDEIPF